MNWKKTAPIVAVVLALLVIGCAKKPPDTPGVPSGPTSTFQGVTTEYTVKTTAGSAIKFVMDWGDGTVPETTSRAYESGEEAKMSHAWASPNTYNISVKAFLDADPTKISESSPTLAVVVGPNSAPVIDQFTGPNYTAVDALARFFVIAHDPDGDSLTVNIEWGDGNDTTSSLCKSPCTLEFTHVYTRIETVYVEATGTDSKKAKSAVPESLQVRIGQAGGVMAFWWDNDEDRGSLSTSLVMVSDGTEDHVWGGCEDDYKFYGIEIRRMRSSHNGTTRFTENVFTGHAAYCAQTAHFIVGSEEGELYSLKMNSLSEEWRYPGKTREESLTGIEWGAPAINGNKIYIGHDSDSLFYFIDNVASVTRQATMPLHSSMVDAPVIDASGNVLFGTDSGYLWKVEPGLNNYIWKAHLQGNGEIHGPVIGADGTIYCTSDSNRLYAVNPADGQIKWMQPLAAEATRPAIGADGAIYLGCSNGRFYKINPVDGQPLWGKYFGNTEFSTTPIISANGYVYAQNDVDKLYCFKQSDGDTVWVCDCPQSLPRDRRARTMQLVDYAPNPTITTDGNIIVVGSDAVYKVKGYTEGPLDPSAPWPKWQKNHLNTGK